MDMKDHRISELENRNRALKAERDQADRKRLDAEHKAAQLQSEVEALKSKLRQLSR
jgi:hypothetical protein